MNKRFCKDIENVENYDKAKADNFIGWDCHHRLETHNSDGERRLVDISKKELIALGMYYDRPAEELIFLKHSEHIALHQKGKQAWNKGKKMSEEFCRKNSESQKGKRTGSDNPFYGKRHSEETRRKISEAMKNMSEEHKNKISEAIKCTHWYSNGEINIRAKECPPGFVPGMLNK